MSGIEKDINTSGRYQAVRPRVLAIDRVTGADDIRRLIASPDVSVGSVAALTETGSLVVASASGSQLPGYAGGAGHAIWIVGAQKVVPDLPTALRRVEEHSLPLETPGYAGGAARAIWIVGAQKVVPDLNTALRRVEEYCLPLESARAQVAYGQPSAVNRLLILNAEPYPGRGTVLLLREAIGF